MSSLLRIKVFLPEAKNEQLATVPYIWSLIGVPMMVSSTSGEYGQPKWMPVLLRYEYWPLTKKSSDSTPA